MLKWSVYYVQGLFWPSVSRYIMDKQDGKICSCKTQCLYIANVSWKNVSKTSKTNIFHPMLHLRGTYLCILKSINCMLQLQFNIIPCNWSIFKCNADIRTVNTSWRHQAIIWTHVDFSSFNSSDIHGKATPQDIPQPSVIKIRLKITYVKFYWNSPGANEFINYRCLEWVQCTNKS